MQQRRVRLGDILDDYCPRERRVTNHVVVAMVGDEVKHTRCSTCEVDHEYKNARVPPARKKKDGVLAARPDDIAHLRPSAMPDDADDAASFDEGDGHDVVTIVETTEVVVAAPLESSSADQPDADPDPADRPPARDEDDGPVHRRLIRATLPRQEGQAPEWKEPDFTIKQNPRGGFDREVDGNRVPGAGGGRHRRRGRGGRPEGQRSGPRGQQGNGNQWGAGGGSSHGGRGAGQGNRQGSAPGHRGGRPQGGQPQGPRQGQGAGRKRGR